jgi:glycosyltransferase involved in cell wall biosynthesis
MKNILFFFGSFGRTGSEVMLLELIKGLNRELFSPYLYLFMKGNLLNELPPQTPYFLPYRLSKGLKNWLIRKSISKKNDNYLTHQLKNIQTTIKADVWYLNTIGINPIVYEVAKELNVRIVTHIHELPYAFEFFPSSHLKNILKYSDYCIACSNAVTDLLKSIDYSNILTQTNFIDPDKIDTDIQKVNITRHDLGINDDEFIWMVSARTTYLKGIDYLPKIVEQLGNQKYKIIWVGGIEDKSLVYYIQILLDKKHPNKVIFMGALNESYYSHLNLADGFLLPSKEESFSLATAEAAYLGIPIVCFDYGAAQEIVTPEIGTIVNSWNVSDLVSAMQNLMKEKLPHETKTRRPSLYFTKEKQLPHFNKLLTLLTT